MEEKTMAKAKKVSESRTEQVHIVMPADINGYDRLFGGRLVEWIDVVAGVVARRHSNRNVTTLSIDNLIFKAPAYVNQTIILIGKITNVGRTSMEVKVDTYVEDLNGDRSKINTAYLVMVALDESEHPCEVPKLILENESEELEWHMGEKRKVLRKLRKQEKF